MSVIDDIKTGISMWCGLTSQSLLSLPFSRNVSGFTIWLGLAIEIILAFLTQLSLSKSF